MAGIKASAMRPGSGGINANAKGSVAQRQSFGKGKAAPKVPAKKPGVTRDTMRSRKGSPFGKK